LAYEGDPASSAGQAMLWDAASALVPRRGAGAFNQALMELGSLVCAPRTPDCEQCPAQSVCLARRSGRERELPRQRAKTPITPVHEAAVVIRRGGRVFLRQCGEGERWAGLWDFPRFGWSGRDGDPAELAARTRELTGLCIDAGPRLATITHGVTRYRITLSCFAADWRSGRPSRAAGSPSRWARPGELEALPLSVTGRKISRLLANL
jgi:A/G-specific adenine glycosylase